MMLCKLNYYYSFIFLQAELNELLNDIETFMGKLAASVTKDGKKKNKKKKGKGDLMRLNHL